MLNISAIKDRGLSLIPLKSVWLEVLGLCLCAAGLLVGVATLSFDPNDYQVMQGARVANMAGPVGVWLAQLVLGNFGIVGIVWPLCLTLVGSLTALGFIRNFEPKRLVGFTFLTIFSSGIAEIAFKSATGLAPYFGYGGNIGRLVGNTSFNNFGYNGSLILLSFLALVSLVMTGNVTISRTHDNVKYLGVHAIRLVKLLWGKINEKPASDEDLIRAALAVELRSSKSLSKAVANRKALPAQNSAATAPSLEPQISATPKKSRKKKSDLNTADMIDEMLAEGIDEQPVAAGAVDSPDGKINFYYDGPTHNKPSAHMFSRSTKAKSRKSEFEHMAKKLTEQLAQFKVEGRVKRIVEGPVVTTYEFEPVPGTKLSKIVALSQDLARLLQATSIRILAPIPGKKVCGFEVPNAERKTIGFADLAEHRDLKSSKIQLPIAMGSDAFGEPVIEDLAKMPHLLVAGSTGSGKSVFMNSLIASLICRHSAKDLRFIMVDPKMVELVAYNDLPHMACPVVSDPAVDAKAKLDALVEEMEDRFRKMQMVGARNIQSFNEIIKTKKKTSYPKWTDKWQAMPYIVLIIDELADMMMVLGKEVEVPITRLAQKARAAGIHLVIATQRPSAEVVTGLIKSNFPTRVAFRVLSGLDSRTILDQNGAEALIGQGDMLYLNAGGVTRMHGAYLSEGEVHKMVKAVKK